MPHRTVCQGSNADDKITFDPDCTSDASEMISDPQYRDAKKSLPLFCSNRKTFFSRGIHPVILESRAGKFDGED
jgi:hypothetical protein